MFYCPVAESIMQENSTMKYFQYLFLVSVYVYINKEENEKKNASGLTAPCAGDFISYCTSVY